MAPVAMREFPFFRDTYQRLSRLSKLSRYDGPIAVDYDIYNKNNYAFDTSIV